MASAQGASADCLRDLKFQGLSQDVVRRTKRPQPMLAGRK